MSSGHGRRTDSAPSRAPAGRGARPSPQAVLALQRVTGNAGMQTMLARKPAAKPAAAATFRVMIVDDGNSGLDRKTLDAAIGHVRDELKKITDASTDPGVKAGFTVDYRQGKPEYHKDLEAKDLDVTTWVVFLIRKGDAKKAVDISYDYLKLDHAEREKFEKNAASHMATEGGHNLQTYKLRRGHPSQSVSFVGTDEPKRLQGDKSFGSAGAARLMAEVILHELGHAMGHVHYQDDPDGIDHDGTGIMAAQTVIGTAGPYAPTSFSTKSAGIIRARLEQLAGVIASRAAKAP